MGWFSDFAPVIGGGLGFAVGGPARAPTGASIGSQYANYQLGKENYALQSAVAMLST